jgi:zinc protease
MDGFNIKLLIALTTSILLATGCSHFKNNVAGTSWQPNYSAKRVVLDNGLTVLFVEDHSAPVVSYTTWFKVGSAWEKPGATGIAHLFEHMMFKGTPRVPASQFHERLEGKGAIVNAFTHQDATVYYSVISSEHLESVIELEADRLENLTFGKRELDSEREVVKEERRLRVDSDFGAQQMEVLLKLAFPDHPYGWPIIGYQEDLNRLTLEQCRQFFRDYYQPGNAIVTIAGDFNFEKALEWINKYYGSIKGHPVKKLDLAPTVAAGRELRAEIQRPVRAESLQIGYYIPEMYNDDSEKLALLSWTLFGMASSRANAKLIREKQLVLDIGAEATPKKYPYLFLIYAALKTSTSSVLVEHEIDALIDEIKNKPPDAAELERVKNAIRYAVINEAKSPAGIASWMASGEFYWGDYTHLFKSLARYEQVTPEELSEVARKYLNKSNRVVVVMKPLSATSKSEAK